ncbi:MAG: GGDEF domain-containing protein [Gammaproteobacteria bacterium]|nr:GGDEF domain-containing protein [Gammaproteobacteria bacterium]
MKRKHNWSHTFDQWRSFVAGIREPEYHTARERDFGLFTVIACFVTASFVVLTVIWDNAILPGSPYDTMGHRLFEAALVAGLGLLCWWRPGSRMALIGFILVPPAVALDFTEVLAHFGDKAAVGIGGFLYFFIFVPFMGRAFGLVANITALATVVLIPNLLHFYGIAPHLPIEVFNAYVGLVFLPIILIMLALEFLHWRMYMYRHELTRRAQHDELTGLPNRRHFIDMASRLHAAAPRQNVPVSVFYIDLDRFKEVNDEFGHDAGDNVLRHVANVLEDSLRRNDVVARMGGEEFVAWLHDTDHETACHVAERVRKALETQKIPINSSDITVELTASIGVATCAQPTHSPGMLEELLARADEALYEAKARGRNCVSHTTVDTQAE